MVKTCDNCGYGGISEDFHRVFSDDDGYLPGCLECKTNRALKEMH